MKHHPFTEICPLMRGEDFEKFKANIAANGLLSPILTYDGQLLDGRNRERACEETGVPARYEDSGVASDEAALDLVFSLNVERRHLSLEERAFAAARLATIKNGGDRKSISFSREKLINSQTATLREAATKMKVSYGSAARAKAVLVHGDKDDENDVVNGKVTLTRKAEDLLAKHSHKTTASRSGCQNVTSANYVRRPSVSRPALPAEEIARIRAMPEKMVSIHVLIEELVPLFEQVMTQAKVHQARVSQGALAMIASEGQRLLDSWASDDPSVRRLRGRVVPFKQVG